LLASKSHQRGEGKRKLNQSKHDAVSDKAMLLTVAKMPTLVKATALAAVAIAVPDVSTAAACRHFSIWHFPWPQRCPTKTDGHFINEASPPAPTPAPSPKPPQDEEWERQRAVEKLKGQLNSQKQQ
jgi:hypothetical protein